MDYDDLIVDIISSPVHKKHKKHKRRKSKVKEDDGVEGLPQIPKLKIKIAGQPVSNSDGSQPTSASGSPRPSSGKLNRNKKRQRGAGSEEEERWLDAIESGKLEEVDDELKRIKNPRLMTARQRAMVERRTDREGNGGSPADELVALPHGYKTKVVTEEMIQKQKLKSIKRREQAQEKREKDKKKTVDRLLKKQEYKQLKLLRPRAAKRQLPKFSYISNQSGFYICVPPNARFPLEPQKAHVPSPAVMCGVSGCGNPKRYTCSRTGVPVCSLRCYKVNLNDSRTS